MFVAAAIKELRQCVLPTMVFLVSHYTMVAISQQAGEWQSTTLLCHLTLGTDSSIRVKPLFFKTKYMLDG